MQDYCAIHFKDIHSIYGEPALESPELSLVKACYSDEIQKVEDIINKSPTIDVNAIVIHSPTRGNGSALILTGKQEIAQILLDNGADVNLIYDLGSVKITALDSAYKALEKENANRGEIMNLIKFLETHGAKKYRDLLL